MASEQQERPITYSDVFDVRGPVGQQPITKEDAALMQSLESMAVGRTPKGSTASAMQSAADHNIATSAISGDAHTFVAEQGMRIKQGPMPGTVTQKECVEYVAGQPVGAAVIVSSVEAPSADVPVHPQYIPVESVRRTEGPVTLDVTSIAPTANISTIDKIPDVSVSLAAPTIVSVNTAQKPVTIGQALEAAGVWAGDSELDRADVRAIESAESRATGKNLEKKGVAAVAQSAVTTSKRLGSTPPTTKVTLSDVLRDASKELPADKIVTDEDAAKVTEAEKRGRPLRDVKTGGVAECMQAAAEMNKDM